ncbi:MAG TPA: hypothetical protein VGH28_32250 [Polyangiaceae bacterium]
MKVLALLLVTCACSTTLDAKNYASDCDADNQCVVVVVGDICSCACQLDAINDRDYDKYTNDIIQTGGCRNPPVCDCGDGIGAKCASGSCVTVVLPTDAGE